MFTKWSSATTIPYMDIYIYMEVSQVIGVPPKSFKSWTTMTTSLETCGRLFWRKCYRCRSIQVDFFCVSLAPRNVHRNGWPKKCGKSMGKIHGKSMGKMIKKNGGFSRQCSAIPSLSRGYHPVQKNDLWPQFFLDKSPCCWLPEMVDVYITKWKITMLFSWVRQL